MKKLIMFMILLLGSLFVATATTAPPTAKDVGYEYSINLDTQNYDLQFYTIETSFDVVVYLNSKYIKLYKNFDVASEMKAEGLLTLKFPTINSEFNYNYHISNYNIESASQNTTNVYLYKYPLLC